MLKALASFGAAARNWTKSLDGKVDLGSFQEEKVAKKIMWLAGLFGASGMAAGGIASAGAFGSLGIALIATGIGAVAVGAPLGAASIIYSAYWDRAEGIKEVKAHIWQEITRSKDYMIRDAMSSWTKATADALAIAEERSSIISGPGGDDAYAEYTRGLDKSSFSDGTARSD